MSEFKDQVLNVLEEVCENDIVKENPDVQLFEEGILDSFGTVSLIVEFQERLNIEVSISDFDRDEWATPNMIIKKLKDMRSK
ncbi:D-alanine--poly(phosphoribitol) ligase subunit DltC [Bacillus mycoides]|nr:D-alanine--poly(phosphoribitol) ligase subunit DltC [Bacillus mycoides]UNP84438.1 D-alanine--poly(phosphoribitol) ligase subunit DltC [Bacillus mycoides]